MPSPQLCAAPECERPTVAKGLCMMHYKRVWRGKPLVDRPVGEASGFGLYGVLDVDEDSVLCHECGRRFSSVAGHLSAGAHDMTAAEYKERHGLPRTIALISRAQSRARSEEARARLNSAGWRRFEAARDPVQASQSRDAGAMAAMSRVRRRDPELARSNGRKARTRRPVACPVCAAMWCPLPGGYSRVTCSTACWSELARWIRATQPRANAARDEEILAAYDNGATYAELSRVHGITRERIGQIIRRRQTQKPAPSAHR